MNSSTDQQNAASNQVANDQTNMEDQHLQFEEGSPRENEEIRQSSPLVDRVKNDATEATEEA